jgi:NAD(P)-dependent dehydrogenase (short-subunit alcohol dehydrogenase family)
MDDRSGERLMEAEFVGFVAVVTGAARGIGRAIALRLAQQGADVVIADINLAGAKDFGETLQAASVEDEIRALGRRSLGVEGDLGKSADAEALIAQTISAFGRIDILVNCAGGAVSPHESSRASISPDDEMAKVFAANYNSMVYCSRAAVRHMRERKSGVIINIASVAGFFPPPTGHIAHYGASKAAMINFTRSLAGEVGPDGIRVNAVAPGIVQTARIAALAQARGVGNSEQAAATPLRRLGEPDEVAKVVQFFASDLASYVTGQCLAVSGGLASVAC